ncbi:hypothetical protein JCM14244_16920 [Venenivibrio stagnispumantis]|uniref:Uncharacterized protein n=1 Tax=Venenivibrio stagnispumantis TaxID=407998 RepID=A0AA45WQ12_9AQUI|nr:hypothetical protein [Venenivibrio stagnispumantis]MCW4574018.1 hypothetical protein [Venenivibrio stagnispumantis]SMP23396.1 hypothetical protein SAMN06264868_1293 [Venenivibrio stagnispumantis]
MKIIVSFRLSEDALKIIDEIAAIDNTTRTEALEKIIKEYQQQHQQRSIDKQQQIELLEKQNIQLQSVVKVLQNEIEAKEQIISAKDEVIQEKEKHIEILRETIEILKEKQKKWWKFW